MKPAPFLAVLLLLCAAMAVPAQAQTVVNPRTVEFDPSADHSAVTADNQPVVQRYDLQIYVTTGTTPYATGNLGKPAPQTDGKIRVDFSTLVTPWPLADGTYDARVVAVGPTGTAASDVSNTFTFQSQSSCTYTLSPASLSFLAGGGTGSVQVTTGTGCAWTAASDSTWVVLGSTAGSGAGAVTFTVTSNLGTARTATLTIGGKPFVITQAAPVCTYGVAPASFSFTEAGGAGSVTVTTGAGCSWTSAAPPAWLHFGTSSGNGSGAASFTVDQNTGTASRTTSLTIAGQAVSVTQTAPAPCTYSISPASYRFASDGGNVTVSVTAGSGCAWSASSSDTWATFVGGSSGTGGGGVTVNVTANGTTAARSTTLTIAGQPFAVTEDGITCTYSIAPTASPTFGEAGGNGTFALSSLTGCGWTATSSAPWLTLTTPASGSGGATIGFNVGANTVATPRTATITVAGQVYTVTQAAAVPACSYALSGTGQNFTSAAGTGSVGVTAAGGCGWSASSSAPTWLTITSGGSGSGNGTVGFSVGANSTTTARTGSLTVAGQAYTVTQDGMSCSFSLTPASQSFGADAATAAVTVDGPTACGWTASTNGASWVTLGATTGSGGASVPVSVAPNPNATSRSASVTIGGKQLAVSQAPGTCSYSLSPTASNQIGPGGGNGSFSVTCGSGCPWTASVVEPTATWVTLGTKSGSGAGTVSYSVAKSTSSTARSATIQVNGQYYKITQAAANGPSKPKKPRVTIGG